MWTMSCFFPSFFPKVRAYGGCPRPEPPSRAGLAPPLHFFFAQCKATEASQYNILTCFGDCLFHKVAHNNCLILNPGLHHQYLLTQYLLEFVVNDLVALCFWNTFHRWIFQNCFAGFFNNLGWHVIKVDILWGNACDLHGNVTGQVAKTFAASNKVGAAVKL